VWFAAVDLAPAQVRIARALDLASTRLTLASVTRVCPAALCHAVPTWCALQLVALVQRCRFEQRHEAVRSLAGTILTRWKWQLAGHMQVGRHPSNDQSLNYTLLAGSLVRAGTNGSNPASLYAGLGACQRWSTLDPELPVEQFMHVF
jgi:hypothetical protein